MKDTQIGKNKMSLSSDNACTEIKQINKWMEDGKSQVSHYCSESLRISNREDLNKRCGTG